MGISGRGRGEGGNSGREEENQLEEKPREKNTVSNRVRRIRFYLMRAELGESGSIM